MNNPEPSKERHIAEFLAEFDGTLQDTGKGYCPACGIPASEYIPADRGEPACWLCGSGIQFKE